jgi:hypothetical protein
MSDSSLQKRTLIKSRGAALAAGRERALDANTIEGLDFDRTPVALPRAPSSLPSGRARWRIELASEILQPTAAFAFPDTRGADREPR